MSDFFPIMAWNWIPGERAVFDKMRECGLMVAGFVRPEHLDMAHEAGMKAIVADPRLSNYDWRIADADTVRNNVAEVIGEVGGHPAVFGYYLKDEPHVEEFAGLELAAAEVRRLAPGKWPYINLLPDYATPTQLGAATFEEYLERFVAACRPTIVSYDCYALMEDADVLPRYWSNLETVRAVTKRHGLPFWNIVLTVAHFTYRELTAADARFQAYSTLAYGGRGLSYFTYISPSVGNYRMAPIDQFGNRTPTWYYLQHVNLQIGRLAPTLLKLTSDDVYHLGEIPSCGHFPTEENLIERIDGMPDALVGEFTHEDGSRYVMIVNKSFHESKWCVPIFRRQPEHVWIVSPYTGELLPYQGEHQVLAPGQGHVLKLG